MKRFSFARNGVPKWYAECPLATFIETTLVQEFSGDSGEFIKTFIDVRTLGGGSVKDLHFDPRLEHYLLTSGNAVYELSKDGALLAKHQSNALAEAIAVAVLAPGSPHSATTATESLPRRSPTQTQLEFTSRFF